MSDLVTLKKEIGTMGWHLHIDTDHFRTPDDPNEDVAMILETIAAFVRNRGVRDQVIHDALGEFAGYLKIVPLGADVLPKHVVEGGVAVMDETSDPPFWKTSQALKVAKALKLPARFTVTAGEDWTIEPDDIAWAFYQAVRAGRAVDRHGHFVAEDAT